MIEVFVEAEAGSYHKNIYDENTRVLQGRREVPRPYPFPYGFVVNTRTPDGDGVDCYIITSDNLCAETIVQCEPLGLLEMVEDGMNDHKVIAMIPGQEEPTRSEVLTKLKVFIDAVFKEYPDANVIVGEILPKQAAADYINRYIFR